MLDKHQILYDLAEKVVTGGEVTERSDAFYDMVEKVTQGLGLKGLIDLPSEMQEWVTTVVSNQAVVERNFSSDNISTMNGSLDADLFYGNTFDFLHD